MTSIWRVTGRDDKVLVPFAVHGPALLPVLVIQALGQHRGCPVSQFWPDGRAQSYLWTDIPVDERVTVHLRCDMPVVRDPGASLARWLEGAAGLISVRSGVEGRGHWNQRADEERREALALVRDRGREAVPELALWDAPMPSRAKVAGSGGWPEGSLLTDLRPAGDGEVLSHEGADDVIAWCAGRAAQLLGTEDARVPGERNEPPGA